MRKYLPISVIVPTHNRADYLLETLNAILAQQDQDLEIIVVDDFSTDNSRNVLESLKKRHPQIVLVFLEENLGESNAVNVGWSLATKRFISIVNSDDPPHNNWLRDMSNEIKTKPGFGFYYPNRLVICENGVEKRKENLRNWSTKDLFEKLIPIASAGLIIDKEMLPTDFMPRDSSVDFPSDLIQMFRLGLFTEGYRVEGAWGVWREHQNSLSSSEKTHLLSASFFSNIGAWLNENETRINVYSKASTRTFYLFGNAWKIYRRRHAFYYACILFLKHELFRIVKQPDLCFILPFHYLKYCILKTFKTSP